MRTRTGGFVLVVTLAVALAGPLAAVQAHPCIVGPFTAQVPGCGPTVYDFGPGEYQGVGVWKGPFMLTVGGVPIGPGEYVLRMSSESQGVIALRDGKKISTGVGQIDLSAGTLNYMNTTYTRAPKVSPTP